MKSLALAAGLALALSLSACITTQDIQTVETLSTLSVSPQQIYVAGNLFVGLEKTATNYLRLPPCPATPACRDPAVVKAIVPAVRAGATAAKQLVAYARSPNGPVPVSAYNTIVVASQTLQSVLGVK